MRSQSLGKTQSETLSGDKLPAICNAAMQKVLDVDPDAMDYKSQVILNCGII